MISESNNNHHNRRLTFANFLKSDPTDESSDENTEEIKTTNNNNNNNNHRMSNASSGPTSGEASPYLLSPWNQTFSPYNNNIMSPWNQTQSPFYRSPWVFQSNNELAGDNSVFSRTNGLIGTMVRQEGNVYSLAAAGDLLFTGSDSKNIRVWKNLKDFSGFKSNSGLVKTIVLTGDNRILTGHQDGKIRVWRVSRRNPTKYSRIGSLPTFKEFVTKAVNPKNYVEVRRNKNVLRIRHFDAVSCLSLNEELGLLYSCSWDKTLKIWRLSDSKFLESVEAHDDAINAVAAGFDGLVFTGSADGAVKVWKRELIGKSAKHVLVQVLLKQENAVTALAVSLTDAVIYSGASDGSVNFWTREKGLSHGGVLRGHRMAVLCLEAAGSLVVSGGADKNICVWKRNADGVTHTCLSVFMDHDGPVKCLAAVEEVDDAAEEGGGRKLEKGDQRWILYSGSLDKSVKVWRVTE